MIWKILGKNIWEYYKFIELLKTYLQLWLNFNALFKYDFLIIFHFTHDGNIFKSVVVLKKS